MAVWDLTVMRSGAGAHLHLHGMAASVNDVDFVADGTHVIAAGTDRCVRDGHARHRRRHRQVRV